VLVASHQDEPQEFQEYAKEKNWLNFLIPNEISIRHAASQNVGLSMLTGRSALFVEVQRADEL
jgi:hypothetical protein